MKTVTKSIAKKNDVELVLRISEKTMKCHLCKANLQPFELDNKINHYIREHDCDILHIGQEDNGFDGKFMQYITVAFLAVPKE